MMLEVWPLKLLPGTARQMELAKARMRQACARLSPLDRELFADLSLEAMQQESFVAMGNAHLDAGRPDLALKMFETHILRRPWEESGYIGAAVSQKRQGKHEAALDSQKRARDIAPGDARVQDLQHRWSQQRELNDNGEED